MKLSKMSERSEHQAKPNPKYRKYRVRFVSPMLSMSELGQLLDSGEFESWLKRQMQERVRHA
jgi:hypothetical protein